VADVPRREVLARVLVLGFVELADEFLEDRTHGGVVDLTRVEIDILKALHYLEEESPFVELADGVVKVELLEHLAHVGAEASDIVAEVSGQVRGVRQQLLEVVARCIVEGEARGPAKLGLQVLELPLVLGLGIEDLRLRGGQHTVEPPQFRKRQDYILVLAPLEGVADQIHHAPQEANYFTVVHESDPPPSTRAKKNACRGDEDQFNKFDITHHQFHQTVKTSQRKQKPPATCLPCLDDLPSWVASIR